MSASLTFFVSDAPCYRPLYCFADCGRYECSHPCGSENFSASTHQAAPQHSQQAGQVLAHLNDLHGGIFSAHESTGGVQPVVAGNSPATPAPPAAPGRALQAMGASLPFTAAQSVLQAALLTSADSCLLRRAPAYRLYSLAKALPNARPIPTDAAEGGLLAMLACARSSGGRAATSCAPAGESTGTKCTLWQAGHASLRADSRHIE